MEGVERSRFDSDTLLQDAVVRRLEVIGEAAAALRPATRESIPNIRWPRMVGMRNRLVHEYFRIDLDVVWTVLTTELTPLMQALETVVPPDQEA